MAGVTSIRIIAGVTGLGDTAERDHQFTLSSINRIFERTAYISASGMGSNIHALSVANSNCYGIYLHNLSAEDSGLISGALYVWPKPTAAMLSAIQSDNATVAVVSVAGVAISAAAFPIMIPEGQGMFFRTNSSLSQIYVYSEYGVTYEFSAFGI